MYNFDSTSGRGQKCANALQTKNIDFPVGKCTVLETEEGLDVAWERKMLIFQQQDVYFLIAPVVGDKSVQMHWKRKTLIFL